VPINEPSRRGLSVDSDESLQSGQQDDFDWIEACFGRPVDVLRVAPPIDGSPGSWAMVLACRFFPTE
jgi:hypothetical protein